MTLGDRIAVLHDGRLEQVAPPLEVYRHPASAFVADFIGMPRINWLEGRVVRADGAVRIDCPGVALAAPDALVRHAGAEVRVGVRPQDLEPAPEGRAELAGSVELLEALGDTVLVHVKGGHGLRFRVLVGAGAAPGLGEALGVRTRPERLHVFDARTGVPAATSWR